MFQQLRSLSAHDRLSVVLLFVYGFGNAAAYVVGRTVADSLFLSRLGPDRLALVYLAAAGAVALVFAVYGRTVRGISVRCSILTTLVILAGSSAAIPQLTHLFPSSSATLAVVYVLVQVRGSLGTIQFTTLLNEQFAHRQPERIVGIVDLGATLAGFSAGLILGYVARADDLASWMYLVAVIDLMTMIPVLFLPRLVGRPQHRSVHEEFFWLRPSERSNVALSERNERSYVLSIASLVTIGVVAATIVEFQWKVMAAAEFQRNETALARYFGCFYGCTYLITGALQLFATGPLLERRGVLSGLLLFPVALLFASLAVLVASADGLILWAVTLTKGCDTVKRSMNDPSIQVLYGRIDRRRRHQAITLGSGVTKPLAEAAAALTLLAITSTVSPRYLSVPVITLVLLWLGLDMHVWRAFLRINHDHHADFLQDNDGGDSDS